MVEGPTSEEIVRARNKYISDIYSYIETSYGLNSMLEARAFNKLPPLETSLKRVRSMTKNKIMSVCNRVLINKRIFTCVPKK
jgi:hypothetical protein